MNRYKRQKNEGVWGQSSQENFEEMPCTLAQAPFTLHRFCTKTNGEKNLPPLCESVHTDPHKNATKTEVFENAVKSGYPKKPRFLKTHFINVNATKTEVIENASISKQRALQKQSNVNAQKRRFFSPFCTKTEQYERVGLASIQQKTDTNKNGAV